MLRFGAMIQSRSLSETRRLSVMADRAGLDWLGFPDSPVVYQDTFLHQAEALRATERVHIGPFVTHLTLRHPVTVANALATLDELGPGRVRAVLGTGNSAARGVGLAPSTLAELAEGLDCIRDWWAGRAATFRGSQVPATGLMRSTAPLFVASDGPRGAELAARAGDGLVYSAGTDIELIRERRRSEPVRSPWELWIAPTFSLAERYEDVVADVGPQVFAMANRALRGAQEATVPVPLRSDLQTLHERYDYGAHADARRPADLAVSPALAEYLVDRFVIWGSEERWSQVVDELTAECDGVMFIFGQAHAQTAMSQLTQRLQRVSGLE